MRAPEPPEKAGEVIVRPEAKASGIVAAYRWRAAAGNCTDHGRRRMQSFRLRAAGPATSSPSVVRIQRRRWTCLCTVPWPVRHLSSSCPGTTRGTSRYRRRPLVFCARARFDESAMDMFFARGTNSAFDRVLLAIPAPLLSRPSNRASSSCTHDARLLFGRDHTAFPDQWQRHKAS